MTISKKIAPHITQIVSKLQNAGYEAYLVGGAVRDILIEREPKDYDISTSAMPEQVRQVFGRRRAKIIGRRFKIVHLYHGREIIEISTFRDNPNNSDSSYSPDSSLLVLRDNNYGTSYDDAFRRDFTVNAIFYDPVVNSILDFTQKGLKDLADGLVRVVGDPKIRFSEDPVRMLRALKLVGQYDFKLLKETEEALYELMPQLRLCSKSRLCLELEKILRKSYSDKILKTFFQYGFLKYFLPNISKDWDTESVQTAMKLLACHCKRLNEEDCKDYLSVVLGLLAMPFVNKFITGSSVDCTWKYYSGIEKDIRNIIHYVVAPYTFPKFIIAALTDAIILQRRFYFKDKPRKTRRHPHFRIAREIAMDLNNALWDIPELKDFWNSVREREKSKVQKKRNK